MRAINFTAFTDDPSQVEAIKTFKDSLKIKFDIGSDQSICDNGNFPILYLDTTGIITYQWYFNSTLLITQNLFCGFSADFSNFSFQITHAGFSCIISDNIFYGLIGYG